MVTLIFQIISSVATYMIVLVQFQITEEQSGNTNAAKDQRTFGMASAAEGLE